MFDARSFHLTLAVGRFGAIDWLVVGGYFLLLAVTGLIFARRKQEGTEDYFLGGRQMPGWAVAFSILATAMSAATFIAVPASAYRGDLSYLSQCLGQIVAAIIVAFVFIPVFYRHKVATVYQLLELKVGTPSKLMASWMFMVGRVFASGARLFIGSLAIALILFGETELAHVSVAVAVLVVIGIFYTFIGGIRSIIWTDVIQTCVFVGAAIAGLFVLLNRLDASPGQIIAALRSGGPEGASKLALVRPGFEGVGPAHTFTLWTALLGWTLIHLGYLGTDQDGTQRMLTCRTALQGSRSVLSAIAVTAPVTLLFLVLGLLLWVFYQRPEFSGATVADAPGKPGEVLLHFIVTQMPPGLAGIMVAGVIAAAVSSLNSELNAMSSTFVNDVYRHARAERSERHYLLVGKLGVIAWGVVLGGFAVFCYAWQRSSELPLIEFALGVMAFAYSGLVAVFLTVLLTRRGSNASVMAALAVGFVSVLVMQKAVWQSLTPTGWHAWELASPWQMLLATALSLAVCCLGRQPVASANGSGRHATQRSKDEVNIAEADKVSATV